MTVTKVSWMISIFNTACCIAFFIYRYMLFYGYINITSTKDQDRAIVVKKKEFNPNYTKYTDADYEIIIEMFAYFLGILCNTLLPLGVNTAREKNAFFFFPLYYFSSVLLSVTTFIIGMFNYSPVYILYTFLNVLFLIGVIAIHRVILKEENCTRRYNADHETGFDEDYALDQATSKGSSKLY